MWLLKPIFSPPSVVFYSCKRWSQGQSASCITIKKKRSEIDPGVNEETEDMQEKVNCLLEKLGNKK
jgi:hypothetical protein